MTATTRYDLEYNFTLELNFKISFPPQTCGFQNISLTHLNTEQALAYLLGLRACILQRGPILQPAEIACKNMLKSPILSGGLQVLQPSNPFDEEKGEARSSASTGSTPTEASSLFASELPQPALWPHMVRD